MDNTHTVLKLTLTDHILCVLQFCFTDRSLEENYLWIRESAYRKSTGEKSQINLRAVLCERVMNFGRKHT